MKTPKETKELLTAILIVALLAKDAAVGRSKLMVAWQAIKQARTIWAGLANIQRVPLELWQLDATQAHDLAYSIADTAEAMGLGHYSGRITAEAVQAVAEVVRRIRIIITPPAKAIPV